MARRQNLARACLTSAILCAFGAPALAHPHVFAEARMEVVIGDQGVIDELRHVWRFDELFSSTVLVEFDTSANLKLEAEELAELASKLGGVNDESARVLVEVSEKVETLKKRLADRDRLLSDV